MGKTISGRILIDAQIEGTTCMSRSFLFIRKVFCDIGIL